VLLNSKKKSIIKDIKLFLQNKDFKMVATTMFGLEEVLAK
jgi:hypothetical protein